MVGCCACGRLRFEADGIGRAWVCHCRACQRASAAPAVAWARAERLSLTGDAATTPDASHGERLRCRDCGTAPLRRDADGWLVALASLDEPDAVRPVAHTAVEQQRRWLKPWDGLPRVEGLDLPHPTPRSWRPERDPTLDRASPVSLRPIDAANRMAVVVLQVHGAQSRYVAPNLMSLLEAAVHARPHLLRAIYAAEVPVGLVLVDFPDEDELELPLAGRPFLWRLMVDEHYQGLGYAARAITLLADAMREEGHDRLFVSAVPGAFSPLPFYRRLGFVDTGVHADAEEVLQLPLR